MDNIFKDKSRTDIEGHWQELETIQHYVEQLMLIGKLNDHIPAMGLTLLQVNDLKRRARQALCDNLPNDLTVVPSGPKKD